MALREGAAVAQSLWIGAWYVLAAAIIAIFTFKFGHLAARWLGDALLFYAALALAGLFLFGCGLHHFHLVGYGLWEGGFDSQITTNALIFNGAQALGAPGFAVLLWLIYKAISRRLIADANHGNISNIGGD